MNASCHNASKLLIATSQIAETALFSRVYEVTRGVYVLVPHLLVTLLSAAPADFTPQVQALAQLVGCASDGGIAQRYCATQRPRYQRFAAHWGSRARDFLVALQPANMPDEVVYPFGGGDLMSALVAFPDAGVITTLSLELAGDPRRFDAAPAEAQRAALTGLAFTSASTLMSNDSKSVNLSAIQRGALPGQLAMHLIGLGLHGYRPTQARFFAVEADGGLRYLTDDDIRAADGQSATSLKASWKQPDFSPAFANVEVRFVPNGQPGPERIFRHIAANLSNEGVPGGVLNHLRSKGRFAAMTKAASYLLWRDSFSQIRDLLLNQAVFMVSDSTGIPPRHWPKTCSQRAFGAFEKSFLGTWEGYQADFRELFIKAKPVPMRWGYPDGSPAKSNHLIAVTCDSQPEQR